VRTKSTLRCSHQFILPHFLFVSLLRNQENQKKLYSQEEGSAASPARVFIKVCLDEVIDKF